MPAGVGWWTYLKFTTAAGLSMVAGSQTVHYIYKPLEDIEDWYARFEQEQKRQREKARAMTFPVAEVAVKPSTPPIKLESTDQDNKLNTESNTGADVSNDRDKKITEVEVTKTANDT